jgi:hypothetical protein
MKLWRIETTSYQPVYRVYTVEAETEDDARRLHYRGESDSGDADYGDEGDEEIQEIVME